MRVRGGAIRFPELLEQMTTNWVAKKDTKVLSQSSGGWESEINVSAGPHSPLRL